MDGTLILGVAIAVGLAFWLAAARLLRKLYLASRKDARNALAGSQASPSGFDRRDGATEGASTTT
jgi:hypothetical protein